MLTPTHILLHNNLYQRYFGKKYLLWAVLGGFLPDLPIFIFAITTMILGYDMNYVWDIMYFSDFYQPLFNASHSFIILGLVAVVGYILSSKKLVILGVSMVLHSILDFFVHADDAYQHFFPFSNFTYESPVSYWDADFYGREFLIFESIIGLWCIWYIFTYKSRLWANVLSGILVIFYVFLIGSSGFSLLGDFF